MSAPVLLLNDAQSAVLQGPVVQAAANDNDEKDADDENEHKASFQGAVRTLGNMLLLVLIILCYPIIVLPFYRANGTSDWWRFFYVCFIHPIVSCVEQEQILIARDMELT